MKIDHCHWSCEETEKVVNIYSTFKNTATDCIANLYFFNCTANLHSQVDLHVHGKSPMTVPVAEVSSHAVYPVRERFHVPRTQHREISRYCCGNFGSPAESDKLCSNRS